MTPADHENGSGDAAEDSTRHEGVDGGDVRNFMVDDEKKTLHLATVRGMVASRPDPEEDPEFREHGFDLWETAEFGTGEEMKRLLPGERITVPDAQMVKYESGRGGAFAEWLVENLMENEDRWQSVSGMAGFTSSAVSGRL